NCAGVVVLMVVMACLWCGVNPRPASKRGERQMTGLEDWYTKGNQ
ncbi:MAG: hypothetical protein ACI8WM_002746, partial [Burkholderiaceae bacterium]